MNEVFSMEKVMSKDREQNEAPATDDPCFEAWRERNKDVIRIISIEA